MNPGSGPQTETRRSGPIARALWFAAGWLAVAIGGIGIIVPGLPSTGFFILAAWCFSKCSPRFEQWVLNLPKVGPIVRDYRAGLGMSRRAKAVAIGSMWTAISVSAVFLRHRWPIVAVIAVVGLIGTVFILWRVPLRDQVLAERNQI